MTEPFFNWTMPVTLKADQGPIQADELAIEFKPAPAKSVLGEPGSGVGDVLLRSTEGQNILQVSLGKPEFIAPDTYRRAGGAAGRWLVKNGVQKAAVSADDFSKSNLPHALGAFLEGIRLGSFKFDRRKAGDIPEAVTLTIRNSPQNKEIDQLISEVTVVTNAVALTRDWGHEPANVINPATLAERAQVLAQRYGLDFQVLDVDALKKLGAGAILAVGQGSKTGSRMMIVKYSGQGASSDAQPVVLVGKAITFDTGGYSLKTVDSIKGMKYDKMGGITVLATLAAAAELKLKTPIVGIVCAAENMVSAESYRPDDILTSLSGKTIEIVTTDAEGRLVLADGLTYAQRNFKPRALIDLATLTGGVIMALARVRAGLMSNNDELAQQLFEAGEQAHERLWRMPLDDEYFEATKGEDADLKNSGGREGHVIMGGIFLKQFVENNVPWAHIDIAGTADSPKDLPYSPKGATGFGVRLLIQYLKNLEA